MEKNIIFFVIQSLNDDYARKFGFDLLKKRGFDIYIFNLFNWIFKNAQEKFPQHNKLEPINDIKQVKICNQEELYNALRNIKGWKVVFLSTPVTPVLLKTLQKLDIPYIIYPSWGCVHGVQQKRFLLLRVYNAISELFTSPLNRMLAFVIHKRTEYSIKKYPPTYTITMFKKDNTIDLERTKVILNHAFDYDRYLQNKDKPRPKYIFAGDYILLLPNHTWPIHDYLVVKGMIGKSAVTKEEYQILINHALDNIEKLTGKKIIIAGYPNATKDEDIYEGRHFVLGGDTEQLVKYSSGVMGHHTSAFNFAIIHNKPIRLINFRILKNDKHFDKSMKLYENVLRTESKYVDTFEDCHKLVEEGMFVYNRELYSEYMRKYVISEDVAALPLKLYWDRVADALDADIEA